MSPNDAAFLKSLGIAPEEIEPAAKKTQRHTSTYETCPLCAGKRHRRLDTGDIICLSCTAREQREREREFMEMAQAAQARYNAQQAALEAANQAQQARASEIYHYRGHQIRHVDGHGWLFRFTAAPNAQWFRAQSRLDAELRIDRITAPPPAPGFFETEPLHTCRECGEPCGPLRWCGPCGRAKFL